MNIDLTPLHFLTSEFLQTEVTVMLTDKLILSYYVKVAQ